MATDPILLTTAKPRRRWLYRFLFVLVLVGVLLWFTPAIIAKTSLKDTLLKKATAQLNGSVSVSSLSLGWLSPIVVEGISVQDRQGQTVATVERVTSSKTLLQLARDQADLGTFTIEQPDLVVVVKPGESSNLEELLANYLKPSETQSGSRPNVKLVVNEGKLTLKEANQSAEQVLQLRQATVTVPASATEAITIHAEVTGTGSLSADVAVGERMTGKLKSKDFQLAQLNLAVRRFVADAQIQGRWTSQLDGEFAEKSLAVQGQLEVLDLEHAGPWLPGDRVKMQQITLPIRAKWQPGEVQIEQADLKCDLGTASAVGRVLLTQDLEQISQSGFQAKLDIDLAKLGMMLPNLLKLKPGTQLQEGQLRADIKTRNGTWIGEVSTSSLKGLRENQPLIWDQPLQVKFEGRLDRDQWPVFDLLTAQADFIGLAARGSRQEGTIRANIYLDRLSNHLEEFLDLKGWKFAGQAELALDINPVPTEAHKLMLSAKLNNFVLADQQGEVWRERQLVIEGHAQGQLHAEKPIKIFTATASLQAAGDQLQLQLLEPIPDVQKLSAGKAAATLTGELSRWRNRLASVVNIPREWQLAGQASISTTATFQADGIRVEPAQATISNAIFRGPGLDLNERQIRLQTVAELTRANQALRLQQVQLVSDVLQLQSPQLELKSTPQGYGLSGTATVQGPLDRLQRLLQWQTDPKGADMMSGQAKGQVKFEAAQTTRCTANLVVEQFSYGPPQKPTWTEPQVQLAVEAELPSQGDRLILRSAKVARDGLSLQGQATLNELRGPMLLEANGNLIFDLAKLEPQLRPYLGAGSELRGVDTKPFQLRGQLAATNGQPANLVQRLTGEAGLSWQSLKAYGFDVGPAQLQTTLAQGQIRSTPVLASFGGGQVRAEPTVNLLSPTYDLSLKPGRIVEKAKLTPAVCANALGYALPAIANVALADGLISFELGQNSIPLTDPTLATFVGNLQIHQATVSAGPLMSQLMTLLGANDAKMQLSKEQTVPIKMEKGRVYHHNLQLRIGGTDISSYGSVGLDGTLQLELDVPLPKRFFEAALAKYPKAQEAALKQRVRLPVTGTMQKPQLDSHAMEAVSQKLVQSLLKGATEDLLKKGADRVIDEILKKK